MNITIETIDEIIKDLTENCLGGWIFENGKIRDDVLCVDIRDLLKEFKQFELPYDEAMELCENLIALHGEDAMDSTFWGFTFAKIATDSINTCNWRPNISHNIQFDEFEYNDETYTAVMVHRWGDVRGNYTYYAILKCDIDDLLNIEFNYSKDIIGTNLVADFYSWASDYYSVYNFETQEDCGEYSTLEMKDLLFELKEDGVIKDASEVLNDD